MSQRPPPNFYGKPWTSPLVMVLALLVVLVLAIFGIASALLIRGGNLTAPSPLISQLFLLGAGLISLIVVLVRQQFNIDAIDGHLQQHSDEAYTAGQQGEPPPKVNGTSTAAP